MQVFIPYPDIRQSVSILDKDRLGNQIYRECVTILRLLKGGPTKPDGHIRRWYNHPATQMWWNHSYYLCQYTLAGLRELSDRGLHYPNTFDEVFNRKQELQDTGPPIWWGDERVHLSHQSALLRKDPEHYSHYFNNVPEIEYYWPSPSRKSVLLRSRDYMKTKKCIS